MSNNTTTTLNGFFKPVFGDKLIKLQTNAGKLLSYFPFDNENIMGKDFEVPMEANGEQGFTFSAPDQDAFDLNGAIASRTRNAVVTAYQTVLQATFSYEVAMKAKTDKGAFTTMMKRRMEALVAAFDRELTCQVIYGSEGRGQTASSANASGTSTVVTFTAASWAPSMWIGAETMQTQFYTAANALVGTSGADTIFSISAVDFDNKKLTFTGTTTGISALDVAIAAGTCSIWRYGLYGNEMVGLAKTVSNTGTIYTIDAATYSMVRGNSKAVNAALTMDVLLSAMAVPCGRGLEDDAVLFLSAQGWADLNADLHGNRRYDGSYSITKTAAGTRAIEYFGQNGTIEIVGSGYIKGGDGLLFPKSSVSRKGSVERSFGIPGEDETFFRHLDGKAGYEYRCYGAQHLHVENPSHCLRLTGITAAS
jgi:hypothetical protein